MEPEVPIGVSSPTGPNRAGSMAKQTLVSRLRDDVGNAIGRRTDALKKELRAIGEDYKEVGRIALYGKKKKRTKRTKRASAENRRRPAAGKAKARTLASRTSRAATGKNQRARTSKKKRAKRK
jgi:hypothetical protein